MCIRDRPYNVGLDAAIIMNPQTWVTTGHVAGLSLIHIYKQALKRFHLRKQQRKKCILSAER